MKIVVGKQRGQSQPIKKLTDLNKVKIVHVMGSPMTLAIKPLSEAKEVLLFSAAAHPEILKNSKFVLRHANSANVDAQLLAEAVYKENPKNIVGLYMENDWSISFDRNFKKYYSKLSNSPVYTEVHPSGNTDFRSLITRLIRIKPEVFVINSFGASVGLIMKQLKDSGYKGKIYINNGFVLSSDSKKIVEENNIKDFYYQDYPKPPKEFTKLYKGKFGTEPGIFSLIAYSDYELLAHAVSQTNSADVKKIISYVKSIGVFKGSFQKFLLSLVVI